MKRLNIISFGGILAGLFLLFAVDACKEDVDLYCQGDPTPVVYCLLNPSADVQFVRLGRSFIGGADSANTSPEVDSTVWNIPHEVYIEEYSSGQKGKTYFFTLNTDCKKDTGFFPVDNLRVYSASLKPVAGNTYKLYVYFPDLDRMVCATTTVHGAPQIQDPVALAHRTINFEQGQPCTIRWFPGLNTGLYQMIFRIHYRDSSATIDALNFADYSSGGIYNMETDQMQEYTMGGPAFFKAMAGQIPVIPGIVREVISTEFIMISGNDDFGLFFRSGLELQSNFTNLTQYTNIGNGIGIFASRSLTRVPNLTLSNVTLSELAQGAKTSKLGFKLP